MLNCNHFSLIRQAKILLQQIIMSHLQSLSRFAACIGKCVIERGEQSLDKLKQTIEKKTSDYPEEVISYKMEIQRNPQSPKKQEEMYHLKVRLATCQSTTSSHRKVLGQIKKPTRLPLSQSLSPTKPSARLVDMESRRQQLLTQLGKLEQQLQILNEPKTINGQDPEIKALDLVKRMNEERKRREERIRIDTDKIKKNNEEKVRENKRIMEEIQRARRQRQKDLEDREKKKRQQRNRRLESKKREELQQMIRGIINTIIDDTIQQEHPVILEPSRKPTEISSSRTFKIRYHEIPTPNTSTSKATSKAIQGGSNVKKHTLPPVVLRLDAEKHHYPLTKYRQQIVLQEKRRKDMEKQMIEQNKRAVELRRKYNLPKIKQRKQAEKEMSLGASNAEMSKSLVSRTVQTQGNQEAITISVINNPISSLDIQSKPLIQQNNEINESVNQKTQQKGEVQYLITQKLERTSENTLENLIIKDNVGIVEQNTQQKLKQDKDVIQPKKEYDQIQPNQEIAQLSNNIALEQPEKVEDQVNNDKQIQIEEKSQDKENIEKQQQEVKKNISQQRRSSDELSQEYQMQFFKSSNPDPDYKPTFSQPYKANEPTEQRIIQNTRPEKVNQKEFDEDQLKKIELQFWKGFAEYTLPDEADRMLRLVAQYRKEKNLDQQPKPTASPYIFDIDL